MPVQEPLVYAGTLDDGGHPIEGARNLRVTLWNDAAETGSDHALCVTAAPNTPVTAGRFRVVLDPACTVAVHRTPDLWLELEVNGVASGGNNLVGGAANNAGSAGMTGGHESAGGSQPHNNMPPYLVIDYIIKQ